MIFFIILLCYYNQFYFIQKAKAFLTLLVNNRQPLGRKIEHISLFGSKEGMRTSMRKIEHDSKQIRNDLFLIKESS